MIKPWDVYAQHILIAISKLKEIVSRGDIQEDAILYDAALRNLQTLSESTQKLPDIKIESCEKINWQQISGFRNILVHDYLGDIDPLIVATVIKNDLDPLEKCIKKLLEERGK